MYNFRSLIALVVLLSITGCYHATIETGQPASNATIEQGFASGWIYGLVPPSTVQTAERCPNGVARVETQLSFVNQLVSMLTLGIYSPMSIKVTCAAATTAARMDLSQISIEIASGASREEVVDAFALAADQAVAERQPVQVVFSR
jgi:hypothetical protein